MNDQDHDSPDSGEAFDTLQLARLSLDRAGDGVYWINSEGRIVYANETASQMLGYNADELKAMTMAEIDPDVEPANWPRIWAKIKERRAYTFDARLRTKSGRFIPIEASIYFLIHEGRELVCSFVRDITERRRTERALTAAKDQADRANAAKTRFLAAASHDLRQPLHAMEMLVGALTGTELPPQAKSIVSDMQDSLAFTQRLLDSLLDVSELEAGAIKPSFEEVPLAPVLKRVHHQYLGMAKQKGLDLRLVPSSVVVRSDPGLLERILDNLVSNAVRYTDEGRILIGCRLVGGAVRLEVWDSGPGIPEAEQTAIFEDFCQLDSGAKERGAGLGLGLGLVRRLGQLLDHEIGVRSTPGQGAVFWVTLAPLARAYFPERSSTSDERQRPGKTGETIMVVEDDTMALNAMRTVLEAWGYRVVALATSQAARAAELVPDAVIADYRLPGSETGEQVIVALRERMGRELPGIIVTGDVVPGAESGRTNQGVHVLKKPVRPAKLRALIRHLLQA